MFKKILLFCLFNYMYGLDVYADVCPQKILICGVCKDIEAAVPYTIKNIQDLGKQFADYQVIIYENNSVDNTANLLAQWALTNPKVQFISETLPDNLVFLSRTEKIARARNIVLNAVRTINYQDYKYLVMADLDFQCDWPIHEILETINSTIEWDCVAANGMKGDDCYWDRYAYRDVNYPFGPEVFSDMWWSLLNQTLSSLKGDNWIPNHSAFGGLAIYKTLSIIPFSYSGIITGDLEIYYRKILNSLSENNTMRQLYLNMTGIPSSANLKILPIIFRFNTIAFSPPNHPYITCCEHVPLHASMALRGFNKFYTNPKMHLKY